MQALVSYYGNCLIFQYHSFFVSMLWKAVVENGGFEGIYESK